jgi:hypothetical protein
MKFCSVVSEERTDGQDKNNMSPHQSGGRHNVHNYLYEEQSISKSHKVVRTPYVVVHIARKL